MSNIGSRIRTGNFASDTLIVSRDQDHILRMESVSSCPSTSSDSELSESDSKRRYRLRYVIPDEVPEIEIDPARIVVLPHHHTSDKAVIVVRNFLSASRISKLRTLFRNDPSVFRIEDRKDDLYHAHVAYRVEVALRLVYPKSYLKMMRTSLSICNTFWGDIRTKKIRKNRVIPEIEYIVYDTPDGKGRGTFIEPHVDNHSIVTGVVMLSEPDVDFEGGINRFKGQMTGGSPENFREYKLQKGDLVLFRGEEVTHWITPVTRGVREILQWELSRI